ncbi:wd40 repeat-containing protein [Chrysochromulina tobinii]|uniref:Wd40 repeat-containing protein n=1 Tax=Chrysochromulina tobinii TaxID=1460289 RepID=A0A0M0K9K4_9EUKA|nr:wd40 repeat-containing protein [Chrysochromulina tobinii]|eukprot:KOO35531.1 wd40 repeat-containing protein [Chrysochromulina sp. CCMP291]
MALAPLSQSVPELAISRELRSTSSNRVLENVRIGLGGTNAPLHALLFNVKRLALEAKRSAIERERSYQLGPSPRAPRRQSREMFTSEIFTALDGEDAKELEVRREARSTQPRGLAAQEQKEGAAAAAGAGAHHGAVATPFTLPENLEPLLESISKDEGLGPSSADASSSKPGEVDSAAPSSTVQPLSKLLVESDHGKRATLEAVKSRGPRPSDVVACQSALSYMTCWGVDPAFDAECSDVIGLRPPVPQVTFGVRGHGGNFSFLTPCAHTRHHRWQCSSHLTALHSIAAVTLANTLMMCPGYDDVRNACSSLVTHFSVVLPEKLPLFCAPSLSLLASHYVDPVEEVQQAARALMEGTLHRMKPEVRQQLVAAWAPRVLRLAEPVRRASTAAAAGSKEVRVVAEDLSSPQGVSVLVLAVLTSRFFTPLDAELSTIVVNQLTALLDHPSELHRTAAAELLGKGYPIWKAHVADPPTLIRTLFLLSAATSNLPPSPPAATAKDAAPPLASPAAPNRFQAALLAVGSSEPRAFCRAMGEHAAFMSHPAHVRRAAVNALISLVKARGVSLEAELPTVVAAVLRPLDPSVPSLREGCLVASTTALRELVKRYPMMAFHQGTQRLAVGTIEGVVILYDMRTATKWRILQGHEHAVTCLAFSAAGDLVASVSTEERTLRWWLAGSQGFFGFIGLHGSCLHTTTVDEFAHADTADDAAALRIEWASANSVTLTSNRRMLATYTKPS